MRSYLSKTRQKMREYWNKWSHSLQCKMSRGAQNMYRSMPWARKEGWRRTEHHHHKS